MQVSGLDSFSELVEVEFFLKNQETVQEFHLRQTQSDKGIFALSLRGGMQAFVQAVELSGLFEKEDMMFSTPVPEVVMEPEPLIEAEPVPVDSEPEQVVESEQPQGAPVEAQQQIAEITVPEIARDPLTDIHLFYRLR